LQKEFVNIHWSLTLLPCESAFVRSVVNTTRAGVWVVLFLAGGLHGQQSQFPRNQSAESLRKVAELGNADAQNAGPGSAKRWDAQSLRSLGALGSSRSMIGEMKKRRIEFMSRDIGIEQFEDGLRSSVRDELWAFSGSVEDAFVVERTIFTHLKQILPTTVLKERHSVERGNLSDLQHDEAKKRISFDLTLGEKDICRCSLTYWLSAGICREVHLTGFSEIRHFG
jgi:hypothetical protein